MQARQERKRTMEKKMGFGERVAIILSFMGESQRAFSKRTGIGESQLSKLLNGKRKPLYHEVVSISESLGIPFEMLDGKSRLFDSMLETLGLESKSRLW